MSAQHLTNLREFVSVCTTQLGVESLITSSATPALREWGLIDGNEEED
ncbi:hypothetical protein AZE42_07497 [Rhizopogon vesiculosus]|uniref:Uncharacterized protein n=1 Tax=Rhizopogon vesiculosus TaxID=180088 RepID=A0A1J8Q6K3_9AGAM|nr:hypothetical protein AZE42_07497 [Rhizopogon vesiculosus]